MKKINSTTIFLIDGIGAIISTLVLVILFYLENTFGMPKKFLTVLIPIGLFFSMYSLSCQYIKPVNWRPYLSIIAIANVLYCCLTLFIVIQSTDKLTTITKLYFGGELIIIIALVVCEFKILKSRE